MASQTQDVSYYCRLQPKVSIMNIIMLSSSVALVPWLRKCAEYIEYNTDPYKRHWWWLIKSPFPDKYTHSRNSGYWEITPAPFPRELLLGKWSHMAREITLYPTNPKQPKVNDQLTGKYKRPCCHKAWLITYYNQAADFPVVSGWSWSPGDTTSFLTLFPCSVLLPLLSFSWEYAHPLLYTKWFIFIILYCEVKLLQQSYNYPLFQVRTLSLCKAKNSPKVTHLIVKGWSGNISSWLQSHALNLITRLPLNKSRLSILAFKAFCGQDTK